MKNTSSVLQYVKDKIKNLSAWVRLPPLASDMLNDAFSGVDILLYPLKIKIMKKKTKKLLFIVIAFFFVLVGNAQIWTNPIDGFITSFWGKYTIIGNNTQENSITVDEIGLGSSITGIPTDRAFRANGWTTTNSRNDNQVQFKEEPLPVNYGPISVIMENCILTIEWATLFETNNREFVIEASVDGKNWTKIGTVSSKSRNGNSDKPLKYNFEKMFRDVGMAGFSLVSIFVLVIIVLSLFQTINRTKIFPMLGLAIALICIPIISCEKTDVQVDVNKEMIKFIRIGQIDADNTIHYSKVEKIFYK